LFGLAKVGGGLAPAAFGDAEGFGGTGVSIASNSETVTNLKPFASS
jgi:hypothetical protein